MVRSRLLKWNASSFIRNGGAYGLSSNRYRMPKSDECVRSRDARVFIEFNATMFLRMKHKRTTCAAKSQKPTCRTASYFVCRSLSLPLSLTLCLVPIEWHRIAFTQANPYRIIFFFSIFFCLFVLAWLGLASLASTMRMSQRYANTCDAVAGYTADAGQRFALVLFRVLYLWHRWRSIMGRNTATTLCTPVAHACRAARVSFICSIIHPYIFCFVFPVSFIHLYRTTLRIYDYMIIDATLV